MGQFNRDQIMSTLRSHKRELEEMGAAHLALFGSVARGDDTATSDVDILVEFAAEAQADSWSYFGIRQKLQDRLKALLNVPVDLSDEALQKPLIREASKQERLYVF